MKLYKEGAYLVRGEEVILENNLYTYNNFVFYYNIYIIKNYII